MNEPDYYNYVIERLGELEERVWDLGFLGVPDLFPYVDNAGDMIGICARYPLEIREILDVAFTGRTPEASANALWLAATQIRYLQESIHVAGLPIHLPSPQSVNGTIHQQLMGMIRLLLDRLSQVGQKGRFNHWVVYAHRVAIEAHTLKSKHYKLN